jgi:hypothetical protein
MLAEVTTKRPFVPNRSDDSPDHVGAFQDIAHLPPNQATTAPRAHADGFIILGWPGSQGPGPISEAVALLFAYPRDWSVASTPTWSAGYAHQMARRANIGGAGPFASACLLHPKVYDRAAVCVYLTKAFSWPDYVASHFLVQESCPKRFPQSILLVGSSSNTQLNSF